LPKHVDHNNVETFETTDLEKLIKSATVDLEEIDRIRKEEFKEHEIQKEFERRKKLQVIIKHYLLSKISISNIKYFP
jgi:hypothetical protein